MSSLEEVLKSDSAMQASPDGKYLLFATFNDTEVKDATYSIYGKPGELDSQYPSIMKLKYPKVHFFLHNFNRFFLDFSPYLN